MGPCSEVSNPVTNFNFNLKAIAKNCFELVADSKVKVDVVVENIASLLYTVDRKELDHDDVRLKIVPDELDFVRLNQTMNGISREKDRVKDWKRSFDWRREVYNFTTTIVVIIMLVSSVGLAVAGQGMAAVVIATLATMIKVMETYGNARLSDEGRKLEGDKEVIKMMRHWMWLVDEFKKVQQKAKTLYNEIEAELSKLKEHSERMEKSEMKETIKKINGILKDLKSVVNRYGNKEREFSRKYSDMV